MDNLYLLKKNLEDGTLEIFLSNLGYNEKHELLKELRNFKAKRSDFISQKQKTLITKAINDSILSDARKVHNDFMKEENRREMEELRNEKDNFNFFPNVNLNSSNQGNYINSEIQSNNSSLASNNIVENNNVDIGEIIDYINSETHRELFNCIMLDSSYMTQQLLKGKNNEKSILILVDFLVNISNSRELDRHLYWLCQNKKILNGRICNIPIIKFAELNNQQLVGKLIQLGYEDVSTEQSQNEEFIKLVFQLFENVDNKNISLSDKLSMLSDFLNNNQVKGIKR